LSALRQSDEEQKRLAANYAKDAKKSKSFSKLDFPDPEFGWLNPHRVGIYGHRVEVSNID